MSADDRAQFENNRYQKSIALGDDKAVFDQAAAALTAADAYDYAYLWQWWGLPIIQLPADIIATQEVVFAAKPTVIIETGVARGGSLVFMASLLQLLGRGRVIGIDIDIRAHNRQAIESHPMSHRVTMIEGSSTDPKILEQVKAHLSPEDTVMVVLDSDHGRDHVLNELRAYGPLVTPGQYIVVADTLLGRLKAENTPEKRSKIWYPGDEPLSAVRNYLDETSRFETDLSINGKLIFASSPGGYLRCIG